MFVVFIAASTFIISWIIQGFGFAIILQAITTSLLLLRLQAVRVKQNKFTIIEAIAILIPALTAIIFKRFDLVKFLSIVAVRGVFYLYVLYDFKTYTYFTKEVTNLDELE